MIFEIFILTMTFFGLHGTPQCSLLGIQKDYYACETDGTNFELKEGLVSSKSEVRTISLRGCRITDIDCDAFVGLPLLMELNLAENELHEIKRCTLRYLLPLISLNVSHNHISELPSGTFDRVSNLEQLYLNGNLLKTLQPELFDKLTKLNTLDLSNNLLDGKSLSARIFHNNNHVKWLDLSRNDMSAAPENLLQSFETLDHLYLDRCFLTKVPSFTTKGNLKTLKILILSTNQISKLDDPTTFINLDELLILNFAGNAIESISENIFSPLRKLKTIVLKHNHLKQIPERLFQNMPKLISIDLSYNDLELINLASFRYTPMKNLNLSGNKLSYLPANFYDTLTSSGGMLKKFLFTNNPWQCACLREIVTEVKNHNIEYNTTIYDGNTAVCVGDYFTCKRE